MAQRIVASALTGIAAVLLWLAGKLIVSGGGGFRVTELDDIEMGEGGWREPECEHLRSVPAAAMGAPLKRKCLDCNEDFDGSMKDGD